MQYLGGKHKSRMKVRFILNASMMFQLTTRFVVFRVLINTAVNCEKYDVILCIQGVPGGMCQTSGGCSLC
jgi:hypothetical protein